MVAMQSIEKDLETVEARTEPSVVDQTPSENATGLDDGINNPLGWPLRDKLRTYLTICAFTLMANLNASSLTIATIPIMKEFHVSKTRAGYTTCLNVLLFGFGNLLWVPLSRVIGMRPMYLAAILLLVVSNIWSVEAKSFNSLLVSRIVSGLAASAGDAPVPAVVASMFLPSHRGRYLVVFQLSLTAGIFFSPLICGLCVQYRTWRWTCGFITIASAIVFLLALCNIRETRPYGLTGRAPNIWRRTIAAVAPIVADPSQRDSGLRLLRSILSLSIRPQILWASFTIGTFVGWIIIIMISSGSTFSHPPYGWNTQIIGVFSMSGFVGALAAYFAAGKLIDHVSNRLTKPGTERRPEYRLPLIVIPAVIGPMGLVVFGACVSHRLTWVGAAFGYGMQSFGLTAVSNIAITYAVDSYESFAGEALVAVFIIRDTIGVFCSLYSPDWLKGQGPMKAFGTMAGIQYFFLLLALPLYYFGDHLRGKRWNARE